MVSHIRSLVVASLLALACEAESSSAAVCEEAADALQSCGHAIEAAEFGACEGSQADDAAALVDAIDEQGCAAANEGKGDSLFCKMFPFACDEPAPALWGAAGSAKTRFPILLAHGFNTSTTNFWRFNDVDRLLASHGHGGGHVALGSVPPFDTPEVRAGFLAEQVESLLRTSGAEKVNLVCFSMGGLDCRFLVAPGSGMTCKDGDGDGRRDVHCGDVVASVVTLSSPNHGTGIADVAAGVLPDSDRADAIDFLATLYGLSFSDVADDSHFVGTMESMTEARFEGLDDDDPEHIYPKNPKVYYQSWAGWSNVKGIAHPNPNAIVDACTVAVERDEPSPFSSARQCDGSGCSELRMYRHESTNDAMDPLLVGGAAFVAHGVRLIPNDGVSTVKSARFGEFMGCFPADHLDQVGQIDDRGTNPETGFDFQRLYLRIAEDLATDRVRLFAGAVDPSTGLLGREFRRASF